MDQIDRLAGLAAGGAVYDARRLRPDFVAGAELCRDTVLQPKLGLGLDHALRAALAARMARRIGHDALAAIYDHRLAEAGATELLAAVAAGDDVTATADGFLTAIVRHADLVTVSPRDCTRADIERLTAAGLGNPQIVALSELIAFVNFEARIIVGLSALEKIA